jgi:hypothetical protein
MVDSESETSASDQGLDEEEQEVDCRQMKKGFAQRAKQQDIRLALRAACLVFVKVNNPIYERMSAEATDDYCHYASLFIGKIWLDSVRKIIDDEASSLSVSARRVRVYKTRICNYLRRVFPGAQSQRITAPMHIFFNYLRLSNGQLMEGPVGHFLVEKLVPYIRTRHDRRLPPMHVRRAYLRERVQAVIDAGGAKEMEDFWNADSGSDGEGDGGGEGDAGPFGDAALAEQRRTVRRGALCFATML